MSSALNRADLRSRYLITGQLVMDTALHIGGGREASTVTHSPVVRDATGEPFIPGSSLKGAFRAAVERLAPLLGLRTCQLADGCLDCLSTNRQLGEHYQVIRGQVGRTLLGNPATRQALTALDEAIGSLGPTPQALADLDWPNWVGQTIGEGHLLALLDALLCDTCKTFGSVHLASAAYFHDLPVDGDWHEVFQIRDGVGIDRDSERAKEQIKFDYEVVPPQTTFTFKLTLENPRDWDLRLVALGLQEFMEGMVSLGGIRSRGLGRCHLENVKVAWVDLTNAEARKTYLRDRRMEEENCTAFVSRHIGALVAEEEGRNVQATGE